MTRAVAAGVWSRAVAYLAASIALNIPFVLFYPESPVVGTPLARSLAINLVLFLAPGMPLVAAMIGRGWLPRLHLLWVIVFSFAAFAVVLVGTHLAGMAPRAGVIWIGTGIVTNLALALNMLVGGPPAWGIRTNGRFTWIGMLLFVVAYLAFFHGATQVVPTTDDHDFEMQGTGYALLTRLKPGLRTTRNTEYYFAHPPLLHFYVAGSFLYYDQVDEIAAYDPEFRRNTPGSADVRPFDQYLKRPHWLETRTPNVFLGALTVALLGWWLAQMTGRGWLGLLVALAYATTPDVFVRSSYGGYFAISHFMLLGILVAIEDRFSGNDRAATRVCLLAGALAALANHKLILLPIAVVAWEWLRLGRDWRPRLAARASLHPVVVGFAAGTTIFWAYGLSISPSALWMDQFRHHFVDRVLHINARGFDLSRYPSVPMLWVEFWEHTGYLLLPMGIIALGFLCWVKAIPPGSEESDHHSLGWRSTPGLWATWALVLAVAFSMVDWRQTKHLTPLMLPLFLGPTRATAAGRIPLVMTSVLLAGLLAWNLHALYMLSEDPFVLMPKIPEW